MPLDRDRVYLEATTAFQNERLGEAERLANQILEVLPQDQKARILLASIGLKRGWVDRSIGQLQEVLRTHVDSIEALRLLTTTYIAQGEFDEAIRYAERSVSLHPRDALSHAHLAKCYYGLGEINSAFHAIQRAIRGQPAIAWFHTFLGLTLEKLERDQEAARAYQKAISIAPEDIDARLHFARLMIAYGEVASAYSALAAVLKKDEHHVEAHILMAQVLNGYDRSADAEVHLRQAIASDPTSSDAHAMLGYRLQTRGQFVEARRHFERAIEIQPDQTIAYYGLVQSRRVSETDFVLLAKLEEMVRANGASHPDRMALRYALGKAREDLGQFGTAIKEFDSANVLAYQISLGGKPFDREGYSSVVDQNIKTFTPEVLSGHRASGSNSSVPIFIVGMMRSGTTLIEQIVSSHPSVAGGGERNFWLNEGHNAFDPTTSKLSKVRLASLADQYLKILRTVDTKKARITDKMPQNFQMLGLIHLAFPKSPIIHVRRNPVDNCLSIYTTPYQLSPDYAHNKSSIVYAYREYERLMAHWRSVLPANKFLEVDYEEIVRDREPTIRRMIEFCELGWSDKCLHHESNERVVNTPSLWQVRQPIYSSSIERWKRFEPWLGEFRELMSATTD